MNKQLFLLISLIILSWQVSAEQIECYGHIQSSDRTFSFSEPIESDEVKNFIKEITLPGSSNPNLGVLVFVRNSLFVQISLHDYEAHTSLSAFSPFQQSTPYLNLDIGDGKGGSWNLTCIIKKNGEMPVPLKSPENFYREY